VTYWLVTRNEPVPNTGAQRDTPELPVEVCREGSLRLPEQIGAQLNAQVLTEREMLQEDRRIPPSSLGSTPESPSSMNASRSQEAVSSGSSNLRLLEH
jgi:hypothetical protein